MGKLTYVDDYSAIPLKTKKKIKIKSRKEINNNAHVTHKLPSISFTYYIFVSNAFFIN